MFTGMKVAQKYIALVRQSNQGMWLGQVVPLEMNPGLQLAELQLCVERKTGILAEQQRLLVVGMSLLINPPVPGCRALISFIVCTCNCSSGNEELGCPPAAWSLHKPVRA